MSRLTRREFLQSSGIAAGSLVVGCRSVPDSAWAQAGGDAGSAFDAFLAITADDRILVQAHKVEMGQGTYTAFATLVGEELRVDPARIEVIAAPVGEAFGAPMQGTGGSTSLTDIWLPLRETGARARSMLVDAAAERWEVDPSRLSVEDGAVVDASEGRRLSYGELARSAAARRPPIEVELTPPEQWRYIGKVAPRVDARDKVRGAASYGMDVSLPGLRTAVVVHCPHAQGMLSSFDAAAAREVAGVEEIFELPGHVPGVGVATIGIAIVAANYWSARRAAALIDARWDPGASKGVDSASIRAGLANALDSGTMHSARDEGDAAAALANATEVLEVEYALPYLAHATMEPMNCTVAPRDGGCDVYMGTQAPSSVQDAVAAEFGLRRADVAVHNQFLGGGFGRRFFADMAAEAARIANHVGHPVKLIWSREDDMARDFYRPASLHRLRATLADDGAPDAWEHRVAAPSLIPSMADVGPSAAPEWMRSAVESLVGALAPRIPRWFGPVLAIEGANDQPYAVPNVSVAGTAWDPGIPVGIWRSVGHSHNGFVVESFIDELAHAAGSDPADYRRRLLAARPRHLAVLEKALEASNWGKPAPGRFQGVAVHESFDTLVAQVAEVSVQQSSLRVHRVFCAVDCGLAVNPDIVEAQMESAINFGLTAALYGAIRFEDGAAIESNFHDYPMLRMADSPEIEVHILPSAGPPSGVGEPGTPPIAPAVANAVFAATGKRLRELPLRLA